jgi:hypothetical protein
MPQFLAHSRQRFARAGARALLPLWFALIGSRAIPVAAASLPAGGRVPSTSRFT